jgi:hypothetical protein
MKTFCYSLTLAAAILWLGPVTSFSSSEAYAYSLPHFIRGNKVCAINTSRAARIKPTWAARDFLKYRRVSNPRPGDIAVNKRPGGWHAQFVVGRGMCANPSSRKQRWVIQPCSQTWPRARKIYVRP